MTALTEWRLGTSQYACRIDVNSVIITEHDQLIKPQNAILLFVLSRIGQQK